MSDFPDYEDESFPPLPPPVSPGGGRDDGEPFTNGEEEEGGEVSKLAEVPAAKRKGVKRPQPKLDSNRLISERGLPALRTLFDDVTFKGKGHEVENVRLLMQRMENWAHRLFPKMQFEDFIDKVEKLGSKKEVQTCLKRIRLDMPLTNEDFTGEEDVPPELLVSEDPFSREDFLQDLQDPISSTPAPLGPQRPPGPQSSPGSSGTQSSSGPPAAPGPPAALSSEQLRRMELNRRLALERKLARQQQEADSQTLEVEPSLGSSGNVLDGSTDQEEKMEDLQTINDDTQQQTQQQQTQQQTEQQTQQQQTEEPEEEQTEQQMEGQQTEEEQQPEQIPNTDCDPPAEPPQTEEPEPEPELQ